MTEKQIENDFRKALRQSGWIEEKNHGSIAQFGRPDLHVGHQQHGECWIEMKRPGGKLGSKQFTWMLKWHQVARVLVMDSADVALLERLLKQGSHGPPQWSPWMTAKQKRELRTGRSSLSGALEAWSA